MNAAVFVELMVIVSGSTRSRRLPTVKTAPVVAPWRLSGEKEKDRCGGMNAAVFVELMVIAKKVDIKPFVNLLLALCT